MYIVDQQFLMNIHPLHVKDNRSFLCPLTSHVKWEEQNIFKDVKSRY